MWRGALAIMLILAVAFHFKEGMCSLAEFEKANKKGQMPKPICANGFVLDPLTKCAPYPCAPGFHAVCPGVSTNRNGICV